MTIGRRSFLIGCAAPLFAATPANRLAICSETFAGMKFADACKAARRTGYAGFEIEPAGLGDDPAALTGSERRSIRGMVEGEGLQCVGLHSFLKAPAGLHLTVPEANVRAKTWDYFARLIDLAADLADKPVIVLGSSKQRQAIDGVTPKIAAQRLTDGLQRMAPLAARRNVTILMEPLAPQLCNVVNTLAEAIEIVRAVNSTAVQTIFDTHNTAAEKQPLDALIREYLPYIRHVHLNEMDGRRPGAGDFDFPLVLSTLRKAKYSGWLSVEVFDFKPDGETVARLSNQYLRKIEESL
jgi:D-psicose/D-tagatose/L-ribulose 3-epimerase